MSDPLPTSVEPDPREPQPGRDARIEQLLLAGLDHYVAGQYERAISVWTRVHFLDRNHPRARAYIERARAALAERQRESEELLHRGVDAFERGEMAVAREFITKAIEHVGPNDLASALLERLNRLHAGGAGTTGAAVEHAPTTAVPPTRELALRQPSRATMAGVAALLFGVGALVVAGLLMNTWAVRDRAARDAGVAVKTAPLPIVRRADLVRERAQSLMSGGHLRDALDALDEADRLTPMRDRTSALRAEVQRRLFDVQSTRLVPGDDAASDLTRGVGTR